MVILVLWIGEHENANTAGLFGHGYLLYDMKGESVRVQVIPQGCNERFELAERRQKMMDERIHPETGKTLRRGVRLQPVVHGHAVRVIEVPGWYPNDDSDSIHSGEDLVVSDRAFNELRTKKIPIVDDRG